MRLSLEKMLHFSGIHSFLEKSLLIFLRVNDKHWLFLFAIELFNDGLH